MSKVKKSSKLAKCFVIISILIVVFTFAGLSLINISFKSNKITTVNYNENSNIDYKVYLKKNSFFETPYLEKNRTYITSLIDYIAVDFNYSFNVDRNIKGKYTYYIKGTVSANKSNSRDYYWAKDYVLTEKVTKEYSDTKEVKIDASTKINYQFYNNLLNSFKSQYGVTIDGLLNVSLVIENDIKTDIVDIKISKNSNLQLNIPLTTLTIEVPIESKELNNKGILISEVMEEKVQDCIIMKYFGLCCLGISGVLIIFLLILIFLKSKYENKFNKDLKKILKTYDNIIVNANSVPDVLTLNVVPVTSFEELIDAHAEVRRPINYIKEKDRAIFILISDGMAWRYDLIREKNYNKDRKVVQ